MILSPVGEIYRRYKKQEQLLDWFEPVNEDQEAAYLSTKPIQLIEGGNRSGKTECAIAKVVKILGGIHPTVHKPFPIKSRIIATVLREGAQGVILNKLRKLLPTIWLQGSSWKEAFRPLENTIYLRNKSTIQLMSDSQDIQTHRGDDMDLCMIDEECKEEVFDENLTRLADRAGMMIMSMTPHNGMTWSYKKLVKASRYDDRIGYFHLNTFDNYKINRGEWIKNSALLSDKEFAIRIKGERIANEGLVYFMFSEKTHVIRPFEIPLDSILFMGVDFGLNNPHAGSLWAITPKGEKYVVDEYYETDLTVSQNAVNQAKWIKRNWKNYKLKWLVCDPRSGSQRNEQTNETNIQVLRKSFCEAYEKNVPVLLGDRTEGHVQHRIDVMRELLTLQPSGMPNLVFFSNCRNHLKELEEYCWNFRKNESLNNFERPRDANNHLMNACEYIAEKNPRYFSSVFKEKQKFDFEYQYGNVAG